MMNLKEWKFKKSLSKYKYIYIYIYIYKDNLYKMIDLVYLANCINK